MARAFIGTSGWMYDRWRRDFYAGLPRDRWLRHCGERFSALEINATHYRLQRRSTFEGWRAAVPAGFVFAVKAHRYLTHSRLLTEPVGPVRLERERAAGLGPALGAVLWQLPARLRLDEARLETFAAALAAEWPTRHTIEFRDRSWFVPGVAERLRRHGIAVCISHAARWPMWEKVTADFVYLRLHGHPHTYVSAYGADGLRPWADRIERWLGSGLDVHAYFDNDAEGAAPHDAERLLATIRGAVRTRA
jgi:uncharacterized protein YecE (DUF72 family)